MNYRVCIPTAGIGSRLGKLTKFVNKSLVSIANRPILSHLIEQFPPEVEFVIPLGHKGNLVKEFLTLAYPERIFFFAEVSPYEGPGSGLGLSLLSVKQYLKQPFIFISCDTLVKEKIPNPSVNWMAYAIANDLNPYRTLKVSSGRVDSICEKGEGQAVSHHPYIGLAGISDYQTFWAGMEEDRARAIEMGEVQGLRKIISSSQGVQASSFTWYDTGNPIALSQAREVYQEPWAPNILEKENEAIWFIQNQVIKFSDDEKFIAHRVKRVNELKGFVPDVTGSQPHLYRYPLVEGRVLSEVIQLPMFESLLRYCQEFWQPHPLDSQALHRFQENCMKFYRDKTKERITLFYQNFSRADGTETINGVKMPKLESLLDNLDWDWLAKGLPGRFHGDFHFENILWSEVKKKFTFLDWRQDFAGDLATGDIYYDFAKLLHGLIINHELIAQNHFSVEWNKDEVKYDFHRKQVLVECEQYFGAWLESQGYDRKKVWVLTALVYLNIAALHHYPYSLLLFNHGKSMLHKELKK